MRFGCETWSIEPPAGWSAWHSDECANMVAEPTIGALQISAPTQKPYFVPTENMLMRCKVPAFLKCMKWQESECVEAIEKAAADGNAQIEAEAASKTEAETTSDYFKGYAMGVVLGKVHAASKGRLLGCLNAK